MQLRWRPTRVAWWDDRRSRSRRPWASGSRTCGRRSIRAPACRCADHVVCRGACAAVAHTDGCRVDVCALAFVGSAQRWCTVGEDGTSCAHCAACVGRCGAARVGGAQRGSGGTAACALRVEFPTWSSDELGAFLEFVADDRLSAAWCRLAASLTRSSPRGRVRIPVTARHEIPRTSARTSRRAMSFAGPTAPRCSPAASDETVVMRWT